MAIASTKLPLLWKSGFWAAAPESRTDYAMLLGLIFLILQGSGSASLDARLSGGRQSAAALPPTPGRD